MSCLIPSTYCSASGFSRLRPLHLPASPFPRHEGLLGQAPRPSVQGSASANWFLVWRCNLSRQTEPYDYACVTGSHWVGCTTISMKEDGMKQLKRHAKGHVDLTQEEEEELRRKLLKRARNGDGKAQAELMASYGVRVYSEAERASLVHYTVPKSPRSRSTKVSRKK